MRSLVLILSIWTFTCPASAETLIHDGRERSYTVEGTARGAPALLVLHGGGGSGDRVKRYTRFGLAQQGWTAIYPDALETFWNDGRTGSDGAPLRTTDDLGFLRALLARLVADGRVDPSAIFAVGVSNGGAMTQRLICQAPGLLAGAVVTIMTFPVGLDCPPGPPTPTMFILGTDDPLIPFQGGPIQTRRKHRGAVLSADQTLDFYAVRNGCQGVQTSLLPDTQPGDNARVRKQTYTGCDAPLQALIMEGGGHVWPGRRVPRILKSWLGNGVFDINGATSVEDFVTSLTKR